MGIGSQIHDGFRSVGMRLRIAGIAGIGGASILSVWSARDVWDGIQYLAEHYGWGWAMASLLAAALILFVIVWWYGTKHTAILFENQTVLNKERGGLVSELAKCRRAWVIWQAGGTARNIPRESMEGHIERMVLLDPSGDLSQYVRSYDAGNESNVIESIKLLTHQARVAGVEVKHHKAPNFSVVINDHISDSAWARIEILLPMASSIRRPSVLITKKAHPKLFSALLESYEGVWKEASNLTL
jgi:hypothetical protein